jgi:hypothetical protein
MEKEPRIFPFNPSVQKAYIETITQFTPKKDSRTIEEMAQEICR